MTDEQCQCLIDAIDCLTKAVDENTYKISSAIDSNYSPISTEGIEKKLHLLCELVEDIALKI